MHSVHERSKLCWYCVFFFFLFHWSHRLLLCLLKGNPSAHPLREFSKGKASKTMRSRKSSYELMAAAYIAFRCTWMEHFNTRPCVDSLVPTTEPFVQHMGAAWVGILPFCTPGKGRKWVKGVRMFFFFPTHSQVWLKLCDKNNEMHGFRY